MTAATSATSAAFATATPPLPCLPLEGEWIERLASAHTEADLLDVVRGFVSSWHPASLALIPAEARPLRLITREDIAFWAYELA